MAVAPGAEANWSHHVDQNFLFQFSMKIIKIKTKRKALRPLETEFLIYKATFLYNFGYGQDTTFL